MDKFQAGSQSGGVKKSTPEMLDYFNEIRSYADLLSKTSGIDKATVARLDRLAGFSMAGARIEYLYSDEFKGSSTEADVQLLESAKDLNLGPFDVLLDNGVSAWQYLLRFFSGEVGNKEALGGLLYVISLADKEVEKIREQDYGVSPSLDEWHATMDDFKKYVHGKFSSSRSEGASLREGALDFAGPAVRPVIEETISQQIRDIINGVENTNLNNLIQIEITPDPQPQQKILNENQSREDVSNGFTQNSPTHRVSFTDQTLNKTDFTSVQLGSLATGGIRPGEVQLDPNVRPSDYLSQFYLDRPTSSEPDFSLRNAVTLNGLAALTTVNTYVDPLLLDLTGNGVQMTPISDGVLFDTDHSGTLKRSGWADRATGMLVIDDGSGQIKDVSQMFSEYFRGTLGVNGQAGQALFKDGFAALASVDNNADQVIDSSDEIWSQLRVWVDGSHDGKSDSAELRSCNRHY